MVRREAAGPAFVFLGLKPFLSGAEGGVGLAVRGLEELMGGGLPIALLHKVSFTFQPGWAC